MWSVILLALAAPGDVAKLGADEFRARETAHERLRAAGVLAVPALLPALRSEDAEVRFRAGVLLAWWGEYAAEQRAVAVLYDRWPVDPRAFYADRPLRERIKRIVSARGVWARDLVPDDEFNEFTGSRKDDDAAEALARCRRALGVEPIGWPFR